MRKAFQKRQDLSQTCRGGAVLMSQGIVSKPFFGTKIPLGDEVGARQPELTCFLDRRVRLVFYQQVADRNNPEKAIHDELVGFGDPSMRIFTNRSLRSVS